MVRTFNGSRPPRNEMDEQEDTQLSKLGLNDFRPMPRNLFVGGAEQGQLSETDDDERTPTGYATQPKQFQIPTRTRQRHPRPYNSQHERPERSTEPAQTTELEERTRVLKMAMGKILVRLIPNDPLIPLLNRDAQPTAVVETRNSPALSNIVVPTKPRRSGKLNNEPSSSKYSEELMRKNANLERQLQDHGLKCGRFLDDLLENPPKTWNEVNDRSASFILLEDFQSSKRRVDDKQSKSNEQLPRREEKKKQKVNEQWGKLVEFLKYANYIPLTLPRRLPALKGRAGVLRGMTDLKGRGTSSAMHRTSIMIINILLSKAERTGAASSIGTINMISSGMHSRGQSARGRKAYTRQVMTVDKNRPLKQPFEEAEWENAPITFSPADYKQANGEPDVMMPHADPFVATVHIGNHNVNKVFIDTGPMSRPKTQIRRRGRRRALVRRVPQMHKARNLSNSHSDTIKI
ncbi:hypothetical protein SLEP1_g26333 [Rubroshorea leprosula]|uniref:Uncharacterized protein n=1 Tax=Rubroshorea leprosula TaxID=152421 RepID=A0AAV5JXC8_9ROSI|nr:hypothetical protein SLEP1_g26333 [Rubroshorea leprosula]